MPGLTTGNYTVRSSSNSADSYKAFNRNYLTDYWQSASSSYTNSYYTVSTLTNDIRVLST
jgi:hypothetical protein